MNKRKKKKYAKRYIDWLTKEKIRSAFKSEIEREQYVIAWARQYVGQSANFPE